MATKKASISVYLQVQGQQGRIVKLSPSATVRQALTAAGFSENEAKNSASGLTLDGSRAELSARLKNDQMLVVTTKVAGGTL